MGSSYPSAFDIFRTKVASIDTISAEDINTICDAISKIERVMGISPQESDLSPCESISQRLDAIEEALSSDAYEALKATVDAHLATAYEIVGVNTTKQIQVNTDSNTPPFVIHSTEEVKNLNAELWGGYSYDELIDNLQFHNQPDYDSGWFHIEAGHTYVLTHSLGVEPVLYNVLLSDEVDPGEVADGDYYDVTHSSQPLDGSVYVSNINSSNITIGVSGSGWYSPVVNHEITEGSARVIVWKGAPWRGFRPDYDSGWMFVDAANPDLTLNHNMGSAPKLFQVMFSDETNPSLAENNYYTFGYPGGALSPNEGVSLYNIGLNSMKVKINVGWRNPDGALKTTGCIRIYAWRGESTPLWGATTSNMQIHVDQSYSGGNSDGSAAKPYTNIVTAFNAVPRIIAHEVRIIIHGTYNNSNGIYTDELGNKTMIRIPAFIMAKDGGIVITGSTSDPNDTIINCHSDPGDLSSPGMVEYGILLDSGGSLVTVSNLRIIGYKTHGVYVDNCRDCEVSVVINNPGMQTPAPTITDTNGNEAGYSAVNIEYSNNITISDSLIQNSYGAGIYSGNSVVYIQDCSISFNNGSGVWAEQGSVYITNSIIQSNSRYGYRSHGFSNVNGGVISYNSLDGVCGGYGSNAYLSGVNIEENNDNGVRGCNNSFMVVENCTSAANRGSKKYGVSATTGGHIDVVYDSGTTNWPKGHPGTYPGNVPGSDQHCNENTNEFSRVYMRVKI